MTFLWMNMLGLLAGIPALVALYFYILSLKRKRALRYASLQTVKAAVAPGRRLRRHIPAMLLLAGITVLTLSLARPAAVVTLPSQRETIVLAMDVSGSMRATDVDPRRITAAQSAAREFVRDQPHAARIGLVAFSTSAMIMQAPTLNREEITEAIDRLTPQRFTAVGSGIVVSLKAIFPDSDFDADMPTFRDTQSRGVPLGQVKPREAQPFVPVAPGSYRNAVIILMSDGQTNTGIDPIEAAHMAASRGVRIYTVGFGSESGGVVDFEGRAVHVQLDEETLKSIADITRGAYFRAGSESQLKDIYKALTTKFVMETGKTEITGIFCAAGAVFVALAGLLSVLWFGRIF